MCVCVWCPCDVTGAENAVVVLCMVLAVVTGPAAGGPSKLRGAPDGPSRPSMANPLLRLWNADDTVGQLIEAVTASKV